MKDKILEIIQKNYKEYKGSNEAELASAEEIELLFEKEVLKAKIEVLEELINTKGKFYEHDLNIKRFDLNEQLKKLNNESN